MWWKSQGLQRVWFQTESLNKHAVMFSWTHWGRVMHICISKLSIISSENGLSPGRCQAIIWTSAGILLIGPLRTIFNEILNEIHAFSFMKMHLKMSYGKWRPFCLGLNVLNFLLLNCLSLHFMCWIVKILHHSACVNSLCPGTYGCNLKLVHVFSNSYQG